jgi:hypothetical protein
MSGGGMFENISDPDDLDKARQSYVKGMVIQYDDDFNTSILMLLDGDDGVFDYIKDQYTREWLIVKAACAWGEGKNIGQISEMILGATKPWLEAVR